MRRLTAGLLLGVLTAMLITQFAGDYILYLSATVNWYRMRPEARLIVALAALGVLVAAVVYASSYKPPSDKVYTQHISSREFSQSGVELARKEMERLRNTPEYQRKMAELQRVQSAFEEADPETSEVFASGV